MDWNFLLGWAVVILPLAFAISIEVTREKLRKTMAWRVVVISFGIVMSGLVWLQQSRAAKIAKAEQQHAIEVTSAKVATDTASTVTDTLSRQYGAVIRGLYQDISNLQTDIRDQKGISKEQLALNYRPSADLVFAGDRLVLWNRGRTNLNLWGNKYSGYPRTLGNEPMVIGPGDNYYLLITNLKQTITDKLGNNGEDRVPLEIYISMEDKSKYTMHCELWEIMKDNNLTIHTQCHGFTKNHWD
jgi:hypothetical protein